MVLSSRLSLASSLIPKGRTIRDIGADHGLLSLFLAERGQKVYAVENKEGPFRNLLSSLKENPTSLVTPLFQDGRKTLPKDVSGAILLGRGGRTIEGILSAAKEKLERLSFVLIEPQSDFSLPISFLLHSGFVNDGGCYVFERRYYPLLSFRKGKERTYSKAEYQFGPYPLSSHDRLLREYLDKEIKSLSRLREKARQTKGESLSLLLAAKAYRRK